MRIEGVVYYVTGGASGLGLATVHALLARGAFVAILDMNTETGERLARELGPQTCFVRCDVSSEEDMDAAILAVDSAFGDRVVAGVVHCAGLGSVAAALNRDGTPQSAVHFRRVVEINLTGSFIVAARIAAKIIRTNPAPPASRLATPLTDDRGVIILVSSVSATEGQTGMAAYASSKAGVQGLVLPLAREFARYGIRVASIVPTMFSTPMGSAVGNERLHQSLIDATLYPHRFGRPEEFAHLAVAMVENQMLNGSNIRLDGGARVPGLTPSRL